MSKINELIQTLCSDGVEYKKLGDLIRLNHVNVVTPSFKIKRNDYLKEGTVAIISQEAEYISGYWNVNDNRIVDDKYVCFGDHSEHLKYIDFPFVQGADGLKIMKCVSNTLNTKYLYYSLCNEYIRQNDYARHFSKLRETSIPIPPRPVQDEIVRILDEYTDLEAELEAKLSEEIELKQKQYEYCASKLFEDLNVEYISMSELAKFKYGYTDKASDSGNARFIRITDIDDFGELSSADEKYIMLTDDSEKYLLTKGSLVVARTGATYGKTLYFDSDEPSVYASFLIKIDFDNNQVLNRYYWHFTKTSLYWEQANKYVKVGGQQQFNSPALGRVCVPVPSITEQERIVKTLDKYDTYTRDMISALNTELESRKKQYAYYRDQLLTFKRKE
ncbi:restriction endonuclease subunit S [Streptococcus alactolyticus]|uniref:restriction endonuclease subunit S n=1 Tax=Streptococcus alactolyticus TaxID=29389 RepID=UPI003F9A8564